MGIGICINFCLFFFFCFEGGPFCDPRDRDLLRKGILERVLPEELNVSELICYKFGTIVLSVLFENDAPKLGVASNLPNVDYVGNAFRNSIHYDRVCVIYFFSVSLPPIRTSGVYAFDTDVKMILIVFISFFFLNFFFFFFFFVFFLVFVFMCFVCADVDVD